MLRVPWFAEGGVDLPRYYRERCCRRRVEPVEAVSTRPGIPQAGGAYPGAAILHSGSPFPFPPNKPPACRDSNPRAGKEKGHLKEEAPASVNVPRLVFRQGEL
jgi:hypothetical protein